MKTRHLLCFAALSLAAASADTIEMKDGTKLQGTVLSSDASNYVAEIQVTKTIREQKTIPKADVARVVAEDKGETGFADVSALIPVPDLATEAEYAARLKKAQLFLAAYKENKHRADLQNIVKTLGDESVVIETGGVKFGGKLITADQRKPIAYTLDSQIAAAGLKKAAEQGDLQGALRGWAGFEKDFVGSAAYREMIPFIIRVMQADLTNVTQMLADLPAQTKRREEGLKGLDDRQRASSKADIDEQMARYKALAEKEKAAQIKWPTLNPYVKGPLEETKRAADAEIRRLQALDTNNLPKADEAYAKAWAAVTKEGATKADINSALSEAHSASVPARYIAIISSASPIPLENK